MKEIVVITGASRGLGKELAKVIINNLLSRQSLFVNLSLKD